MKQWSGNITGLLATPATGAAGSVTYGSGYVVNAYVWDMTIEGDSYESTGFGDVTGSDDWLVFSPGPYQWGGSYGCYVDSSTSIPDADEAFSSATFAVDGSKTFAGSIATRLVSVGETNPRGLVPVNFEYRGSGLVTAAGSGNLFAAAAVDGPDAAASLVLQAASGKTYTGSAFWTRITIGPVGIRELSRFSIDFQGTGALTIA